MKPTLAITMGDPNGVGPEVLAKALAHNELRGMCQPLVLGSADVLDACRRFAPACPPFERVGAIDAGLAYTGAGVPVWEGSAPAPPWSPGTLDVAASRCALEWVETAIRLALDARVAGIVTGPINKEGFHLAGVEVIGHTELIADMTASPSYRMCLFAGGMRAVHVTGHLPLREAVRVLTVERIVESAALGDAALRRLGIGEPRIALAGLNPHAGEAGLLGSEEMEFIAPAVAACRAMGIACTGPYPPDTVFLRMHKGEFDAVVAMYHDQGHIPLKLLAMEEGVNVTLGIPIVRTSVDHGTAYDIAGTGRASESSLLAAVRLAVQLAAAGPPGSGGTPARQG